MVRPFSVPLGLKGILTLVLIIRVYEIGDNGGLVTTNFKTRKERKLKQYLKKCGKEGWVIKRIKLSAKRLTFKKTLFREISQSLEEANIFFVVDGRTYDYKLV